MIDRRKQTSMLPTDHDILIKLDTNVENLIDAFHQHKIDDKKVHGDQETLNRFILKTLYIGYGGLLVIMFSLKVFFK